MGEAGRGCFGGGFVGCGLWVVGCGLWVVGCGLWVVGIVLVDGGKCDRGSDGIFYAQGRRL